MTVADLVQHKRMLEEVLLDINEDYLVLDHIKEGCVEIGYYIPAQMVPYAYKCSLKNRSKFSSLHIRYLHFENHAKIYAVDPQDVTLSTVPLGVLEVLCIC